MMRNRHIPRLCRSCDAPMAGQEDSCWSCGAAWDDRSAKEAPQDVLDGGRPAAPDGRGADRSGRSSAQLAAVS